MEEKRKNVGERMKELISYFLIKDRRWVCDLMKSVTNSLSRLRWLGTSLGTTLSNILMQCHWVLRHPRCFLQPSERKRNPKVLGSEGHLGLQLKKSPVPGSSTRIPQRQWHGWIFRGTTCQSALSLTPLQADRQHSRRLQNEWMNKSWLFFFWCGLRPCNTALLEMNLSLFNPCKVVKLKKYACCAACGPHLSARKIPL